MGIFHHRGPVAILICVVWKKGGEPEYLCLKHAGKQWCWPMLKLEDREGAEGLSRGDLAGTRPARTSRIILGTGTAPSFRSVTWRSGRLLASAALVEVPM